MSIVSTLYHLCRELNVFLGVVAFLSLCYRAGFGITSRRVIYWPLLVVLSYGALILALGSPTGIITGNHATYLAPMTTVFWLALLVVCLLYPGPFRRALPPPPAPEIRPYPFDESNNRPRKKRSR